MYNFRGVFLFHLWGALYFLQSVFFFQDLFLLLIQRFDISLPTGTEINVPTPKSANQGFGRLVIFRPYRAVFTIMLCHAYYAFECDDKDTI